MDDLGLVDALAQLGFLVQSRLTSHAAAHDLSMIQTRLLGVLRDRNPTMLELSLVLGLNKSSTTGLIDRAQRRGLVDRRASETDGRAIHVTLTAQGREVVDSVAAAFASDVHGVTSTLSSADRASLSRLASAVVGAAQNETHGQD